MSLLEVIALTAADARAAQEGGADRLEVVADMAADGLTPDPDVLAAIRDATDLPLRVMLRANAGFRTTGAELDRLRHAAAGLAEAGADGFVLGFLDSFGHVDAAATEKLAAVAAPLPWTFHRALDHAADPAQAWRTVRGLGGGLDTVLTAGSARGVDAGVDVLVRRAAEDPAAAALIMAGGGLRRKHVAVLAAAGVTSFHVGTAVRPDGSWDVPVDPALVAEWRSLVSAAAGG
ncbi:copper homeostasis protein CutC [Actinomadura algeriensis]|uniref:Copper homeostasis protein cutC homolog n=1 Tax=Actinomadura algeriensis TaxID=1679523 RepID=A0ABR9JX53_9ACTN|nr:copper homeostasis protein CutC [Actinomadura algeriensis]MBE1535157.1 copper homeostasis protein [Actinomadura algeriensis]